MLDMIYEGDGNLDPPPPDEETGGEHLYRAEYDQGRQAGAVTALEQAIYLLRGNAPQHVLDLLDALRKEVPGWDQPHRDFVLGYDTALDLAIERARKGGLEALLELAAEPVHRELPVGRS